MHRAVVYKKRVENRVEIREPVEVKELLQTVLDTMGSDKGLAKQSDYQAEAEKIADQ